MNKRLDEAFVVHDELNPDLYYNNKLKMYVRQKLLNVVDYFRYEYLDVELPLLDILLVGSNASYNYNETSDIDTHIITNFEMVYPGHVDVTQSLFNLEKSAFNSDYNIKVKGRDVELYVEDVKTTVVSNGIYSILKDEWIKFPKKIQVTKIDTSADLIPQVESIKKILAHGTSKDVQDKINELYLLRKTSIDVEGEYGYGNQLFKDIRSTGLLDALKQKYKEYKSQELSVESYDFGELY